MRVYELLLTHITLIPLFSFMGFTLFVRVSLWLFHFEEEKRWKKRICTQIVLNETNYSVNENHIKINLKKNMFKFHTHKTRVHRHYCHEIVKMAKEMFSSIAKCSSKYLFADWWHSQTHTHINTCETHITEEKDEENRFKIHPMTEYTQIMLKYFLCLFTIQFHWQLG